MYHHAINISSRVSTLLIISYQILISHNGVEERGAKRGFWIIKLCLDFFLKRIS